MGRKLKKFKTFLIVGLLLSFTINFIGCGGKRTDVKKDIESSLGNDLTTGLRSKTILSFASTLGDLKSKRGNIYIFSIKDKYKNKSPDFFREAFFYYCGANRGTSKLEKTEVNKEFNNLLINSLLDKNLPVVYVNEYVKRQKTNLSANKIIKLAGLGNYDYFCYFPQKREFFVYKSLGNEFLIYKNSIYSVLAPLLQREITVAERNIRQQIRRDIQNLVWVSLNLPLYYRGVKLYYFWAEPLDKGNLLRNEIWNVSLKLKNKTSKFFILNLANITLIKRGKEYKPVFHIDSYGRILDFTFRGDCRDIGDNKIAIEPGGICEIRSIKRGRYGGLRFIGLDDLKGSILLFDKYPIYIWSFNKFKAKVKSE